MSVSALSSGASWFSSEKGPGRHRYRAIALGLSIGVHFAVASAIGVAASGARGWTSPQALPLHILSVSLAKPEPHAGESRTADPINEQAQQTTHQTEPAPSSENTPAREQHRPLPLESSPILPISGHSESRYFLPRELTDRPLVARDHVSTLSIYSPGLPSRIAEMRLFINEHGDVDRIAIEKSGLPEQVEHLIADAFSSTKFHPGKIDRVAVKAQIRIEVAIESAEPHLADPSRDMAVSPQARIFTIEHEPAD